MRRFYDKNGDVIKIGNIVRTRTDEVGPIVDYELIEGLEPIMLSIAVRGINLDFYPKNVTKLTIAEEMLWKLEQ